MELPRKEALAILVLRPPMLWDDFINDTNNAEFNGIDGKQYGLGINSFVFSKRRDYAGFREFLGMYSAVFKDYFHLFEDMSDEEIDYVLDRVREERVKYSTYCEPNK